MSGAIQQMQEQRIETASVHFMKQPQPETSSPGLPHDLKMHPEAENRSLPPFVHHAV